MRFCGGSICFSDFYGFMYAVATLLAKNHRDLFCFLILFLVNSNTMFLASFSEID